MKNTKKELKIFDSHFFTTNPRDFVTWVDRIYYFLGLPPITTSILIFIILYLIGIITSLFFNFLILFIKSPFIYIGIFGISWVFYITHWGSINIHKCYKELRPCFIIDDKIFKSKLIKWFNIFRNTKDNFRVSFYLLIFILILYFISFYHPGLQEKLHLISLRPLIVPKDWFIGSFRLVKFILILFYLIFVCLLLGTASRALCVNLFFLLDLRKLKVIPISNIIRSRLRNLTDYYLKISLSWFVGVMLFGILFYYKLDILSIFILSTLSIIGIFTFFVPQILFRKYLISSYRILCDISLKNFYDKIGIVLKEKNNFNDLEFQNSKLFKLDNLVDMLSISGKPPLWVYDYKDFLILILGQSLAFLGVFLQNVLDKYV